MAKLGFLGLGIMGAPMARHLLEAGHEVALWSNISANAEKLAGFGKAILCRTPADVASHGGECLFVCVGDTEMSQEVILGERGIAFTARPGTVVVDCSSIAPTVSKKIAAELRERGIDFLDAPVTGSSSGAEAGTLTFMVGGDPAVLERVRPVCLNMGSTIYHCGENGMGLHAKLSQNLMIGNLIKWLEKDMRLMFDSAAEFNVRTPLTSLSADLLRSAVADAYGKQDIRASMQVLEQVAHVELIASSPHLLRSG